MAEWRNRSLMVKESFQDWNLFHKSVVIFFVILFSAAFARGVFVVEGGTYLVQTERVFPFNPDQIIPWVVESENRARWQAEVTEFLKFSGDDYEVGSTRRAYHKRRGEEWFAFEQTVEVGQKHKVLQQDNVKFEDRSLEVSLKSLRPCETMLVMKEVIYPRDYSDRYWAFLEAGSREKRLEVSMDALERWFKTTKLKCDVA